jgi:hypothetical protein
MLAGNFLPSIEFCIHIAAMAFLSACEARIALTTGDGLVALGTDGVDGGIRVSPPGERDKARHSVTPAKLQPGAARKHYAWAVLIPR